MIHVKKSVKYYINERSLTFSENDLDDPQRVAVSLVSGTVIMVRVPGVIDYASDGNFERWTLKGYSTKLVNNALHYVYARLSRTDRTALVVFSLKNYNIDGSITTVTGKDESGNDITETTDPSTDYFYIKIGELTATDGKSERELTYDSGLLGTEQGNEESSPLNEMWELSKLSTPWLIRAKQWLYSFTVKGFITLIGGLVFRKGEEEKSVNDIKRSGDSDTDVPVSDDTLPTTRYVSDRIGELDGKFLRKDQDDRTEHSLEVGGDVSVEGGVSSEKGFRAGTYVPGATGAACYQDEQGAWQPVAEETPVSMNFWGFTPDYFKYSEEQFVDFLKENIDKPKAEYFIPLVVNNLTTSGTASCEVLDTTAKWFGVTYAADRPATVEKIQQLVDAGEYPEKLF